MSWRLTYNESGNVRKSGISGIDENWFVKENELVKSGGKIELRDTNGQIIRLAKGAEFILKNSPYGIRLEYYGEIAIMKKEKF